MPAEWNGEQNIIEQDRKGDVTVEKGCVCGVWDWNLSRSQHEAKMESSIFLLSDNFRPSFGHFPNAVLSPTGQRGNDQRLAMSAPFPAEMMARKLWSGLVPTMATITQ